VYNGISIDDAGTMRREKEVSFARPSMLEKKFYKDRLLIEDASPSIERRKAMYYHRNMLKRMLRFWVPRVAHCDDGA
jgi:hypothetical protein